MAGYIARLIGFLKDFFLKGEERSIEAKKNIMASFLIKGCSIAISLILVPLALNYVNPSQYGIWLTLSSMVAWMAFFDIGFTQGLRNKFAEAKAKGDLQLARIYVSTTYYYIGIIFIIIWVILLVANHFVNWAELLNLPAEQEREVSMLAIIILSYFSFQFVFRIINTILIADQKPAKASFLDMLGQLISLVIIFLLTRLTKGSLIFLGLAYSIAPVLVLIIANILFFKTQYRVFAPTIKLAKREYAKDIMTLGIKFFVLQIANVVQYQTASFLIAHYFDTTQVTSYNIAYKYFSVLQMVFMIAISPLWSGTTDAYNSGDIEWIKKVVRKYLIFLVPFILGGAIMLIFAKQIYDLWLGKDVVEISFYISLLCYLYFSTGMFASIFVAVLNGIGALKIQFYSSIITSIMYLIIVLLLIRKFNFGVEAVLIASIISNVYGYILAPTQYYKVFIKKSRSQIWYA
jgi:O-antigen/teichoic acid export membrane protein